MGNIYKRLKRMTLFVLLLTLVLNMAAPIATHAQEKDKKVVRVGWYESTFCYRDRFGRRRGIDYEYQHKISAYTGWTFEYVEDSWSNLLQKLMAGEIDLLSDVSYTEERTKSMLFPDLPMGTESYYIFIDADNKEITSENLASFNGKRVGVNKGSVQEGFLKDWARKKQISIEVVPLTTAEADSMAKLARGELDGYATINTFGAREKLVPVCRIGSSDFFYAVNKNRPDLLDELNRALAGIQDEDQYFNQRVSEENLYITRTNAFLTPGQEEWLTKHGVVRVGYRDDYLPFCAKDPETGEVTGALKDYLAHAVNSLKNSGLRFETVAYPTTEAALEAMKAGEVDCVFPVNLSSYDSDAMDIRLTNPVMKTEMQAVMRNADHHHISRDSNFTFAVNQGNVNIETFIKDYYPDCKTIRCPNADARFEALASGEADCVLASNYRLHDIETALEKNNLFSVPTGEAMPFSFATRKADRELYFILNKTVILTRSDDMDAALASYAHTDQKVSFLQFFREHWLGVIAALSAVFLVIIVLLLQKLKAERKADVQQRLLEEAAKVAELKQSLSSLLNNMPGLTFSKDAKTGVYRACNQAFAEYAHKPTPEDVVGHTDAELFDEATARHFVENDIQALASEEPRVYFEEVLDAAGNPKQFQTTKLKFIDEAGRPCVLGICEDLTDNVRIQREHEATKEAYEKVKSTNVIFTHIARTLARGYTHFYYVNLDTEAFIEYQNDEESGEIVETRRGVNFFEACREDAKTVVYPEDLDNLMKAFDRQNMLEALNRDHTFMMPYRLLSEDGPVYVNLRASRMDDDDRFIIIGITDIDEQVKHRHAEEQMKEERIAFSRINALAGDFICIYIVDPETERYMEYSAGAQFESFSIPKEGTDFFATARKNGESVVYPDDLERVNSLLTKENVFAEIERSGIFALTYRLMINGKSTYVRFKAAMVEEAEGRRLIVGLNNVDAQVRHEEEYAKRLAHAQREANIDALTGVKNRHAYLEAEEQLDRQIAEHRGPEFAIVIMDVNDLKEINDTQGHHAGDEHIRGACRIICNIFKRSPVFRLGGDEFAVVAEGSDYHCIEELIGKMSDYNSTAMRTGGIVIACGMSKFAQDDCTAPVFERADQNMYVNKSNLKAAKNNRMSW
ncbi:MAG: transporter substrate-binding domain-containing protein [Schwartzia sp.]|nr:transporter substrate-binding domain-containing protein [Schwartzia sp. (in: firmicutes)]